MGREDPQPGRTLTPTSPVAHDFHRNFCLLGGLAGDQHRLQDSPFPGEITEAWPPGGLSPDPRLTARLCSSSRVSLPWPRDGGLRPSPMLGVGAVPQLQSGGGRAGKSGVPTLGRMASSLVSGAVLDVPTPSPHSFLLRSSLGPGGLLLPPALATCSVPVPTWVFRGCGRATFSPNRDFSRGRSCWAEPRPHCSSPEAPGESGAP